MLEILNALQPYSIWLGGLVGLIIGSFLNVVIHRTPLIMESQWHVETIPDATTPAWPCPFNLATPASHCPHCRHTLAWWENLPVLSYLLLQGRCRACDARIGWRYPAVEMGTGLALAACFQHWGLTLEALAWCGFVCTLVVLAVIDWNTTFLPDHMTQPLTWAGLIAAALGLSGQSLNHALWGAVAGYLSLWTVYWIFKLLTGKEGMGYGDFKLFAALGAWFGWTALIPLILLASLGGIAVGMVLLRHRPRENQYIPFGPFLAMAAGAYMVGGDFFRMQWMGMTP